VGRNVLRGAKKNLCWLVGCLEGGFCVGVRLGEDGIGWGYVVGWSSSRCSLTGCYRSLGETIWLGFVVWVARCSFWAHKNTENYPKKVRLRPAIEA
jgi:hypothetical protein